MADIAEIGFAYNPAGLKKAKADLDAILPSAKKVEAAKLAVAKADLESARAALAAAKASDSATKEQIVAANSAVKKANASLAAARADEAAAGAAAAVGKMSAVASGDLDRMGNSAQNATTKLARLGTSANDNLNAVQATPANIAAQFQDIGVTAAAGMNPMLIALQQGTQLSVAFSGGLKNIGAALKQVLSPMALLTIGIVALIAHGIQLAMEFFNIGQSAKKLGDDVERTALVTSAFGDAQSILGGIMDMTTGKMKDQTEAARTLAKALAFQGKVKAQQGLIESKAALDKLTKPSVTVLTDEMQTGGRFAGLTFTQRKLVQSQAGNVVEQFTKGKISAEKAIDELGKLQAAGKTTLDTFMEATTQINNQIQSIANAGIYEEVIKAENGDVKAAQQFLKPDKPKKDRGKSDGEKLIDVWAGAQAEIATENTRRMAAGLEVTSEAAATMAQRSKLLNELQTKGLPITEATRAKVEELAIAYGKAKAAADNAEAVTGILKASDAELAGLQQQIDMVGKYGRELAYAASMAKMLADAKSKGMTDTDIGKATPLFEAKSGKIADLTEELRNKTFMEGLIEDADKRNRQLEVERNELGLTGAALIAYRYEQEMLNAAEAQHIVLSKERQAAIKETARLYGEQAEAIDKARQALEFDRNVTRGFFTDLVQGARDGKNAWEAFKDAFNNVMDKIIDKLLNEVLDAVFQVNKAAAGGGSGGILGAIGKIAGVFNGSTGGGGIGGDPAEPGLFAAKGHAFSNSVVHGVTPFAFGKGGANLGIMGEKDPEAIMPLTRGPNGSLGVQMYGNDNSAAVAPQQGPITFDMRGAVVTQDLLNQMNAIASERADVAVQRNNAQNTRMAQRKFSK